MVRISNTRSKSSAVPPVRELPRTVRRTDARKLEILRAAGRTFRRLGFAAAGMREIAAEADLSPANIYHYFRGKHEILYFCQDRSLDLMLEALRAARASRRPAPEQLRQVVDAHVRCLLDDLEGSAAHLEVGSLPHSLRDRLFSKRDRYERGIRSLIAAGVRRGELSPCDPTLVTRAILGAANWTARWFRPDGSRTAASVADGLADYLTRGLVASPPEVARASAPRASARVTDTRSPDRGPVPRATVSRGRR